MILSAFLDDWTRGKKKKKNQILKNCYSGILEQSTNYANM